MEGIGYYIDVFQEQSNYFEKQKEEIFVELLKSKKQLEIWVEKLELTSTTLHATY